VEAGAVAGRRCGFYAAAAGIRESDLQRDSSTRARNPAEIEIAAARQTSDEWGFSVRDNSVGVDPENGSARFSGWTLAMNSKAPAMASPTSAASSCARCRRRFSFTLPIVA
jgi:hypothetical protein